MSNQIVSTLAITPLPATENIVRRSANYHPSFWGDYFISHIPDHNAKTHAWVDEAEILKQKVRRMLTSEFTAKPLEEKLNLIDEIQRLGILYHFEGELEEALKLINNCYGNYPFHAEHNLRTTSLLFRLLREYGYNISCDIFTKFKDHMGSFKDDLGKPDHVEGMLSLYEATHLRVHGETILDEALAFSRAKLESMVTDLDPFTAKRVLHALYRPIRKGLIRLEAREYISFYEENESHNEIILKFAKLDFNILQKLHQEELRSITKWWKNLDFNSKLPFARDRLAECYFWILGIYYEPQYAIGRKFTTKVISITSVIDDIYDNYGIKSELEKFTDAVNRWEIGAMDELPEYMKVCYQALLNVYDEMEEEMRKEGRTYAMHYAKEAMKQVVKAYFDETKWLNTGQIPTMEEYMKITLVSSGYPVVATASIVGVGEIATKEVLDWLVSEPQILKASSFIARIMDDIVSYEFEQQRDHVPSAVQCYMNQYNVSERQACANFEKQIEDAWKDINQAFLESRVFSPTILKCILNMARVIDLLYKEEDGYTNVANSKQHIARVLVDPVDI